MTYRVLDLFSGIGGFSLGLERTGGFKTVAFCEINPFCRRVLKKHWPEVPCYDDVRTMEAYRTAEAPGNGFIRGRPFGREDCGSVRRKSAVHVGRSACARSADRPHHPRLKGRADGIGEPAAALRSVPSPEVATGT